MQDIQDRFFTANSQQKNTLEHTNDIIAKFSLGDKSYYHIKLADFESLKLLTNDDYDDEYISKKTDNIESIKKLNEFVNVFFNNNILEISRKEYKAAEKFFKENKQKTFLDNFSEQEKFIYYKTKDFIEAYDFETSQQKSFLISLRNIILQNNEMSSYTLDEHAQKSKKNLDDIFDVGQQGMIVDFVCDLQLQLKNEFNTKNKIKI